LIPEIQQRYNDDILHEAARRYGVAPENLKNLGGFESFVYEYEREGRSYILKITHTIRRTVEYLLGELEWVNHLVDGGVPASRCVLSDAGNLVEIIEEADGEAFLVMSYEKALGTRVKEEHWGPELFTKWGRMVGRMHKLTKSYVPRDPALKRQEWYEEDQLNLKKYLDEEKDADIFAAAEKLLARIHALPRDADSYGLCHTDLHAGNFHIDEQGAIKAFDFDDCQYSWFIADIAIVLYYVFWFKSDRYKTRQELTQDFMENFMRGYSEENHLDPKWMVHIHDFLRLRNLLMYVVLFQCWDTLPQSVRDNLPRHRQDVINDASGVEFDFTTISVS